MMMMIIIIIRHTRLIYRLLPTLSYVVSEILSMCLLAATVVYKKEGPSFV